MLLNVFKLLWTLLNLFISWFSLSNLLSLAGTYCVGALDYLLSVSPTLSAEISVVRGFIASSAWQDIQILTWWCLDWVIDPDLVDAGLGWYLLAWAAAHGIRFAVWVYEHLPVIGSGG